MPQTPVTADQVTEMVTGLQLLAARLDAETFPTADVRGVLTDLGQAQRLVSGMVTVVARRATDLSTASSKAQADRQAAELLAASTGTSNGSARRTLQTSTRLRNQARVRRAVLDGRLSTEQAAAVADAAEADPGATDRLLEAAASQSVTDLKKTCRDTRHAADPTPDATRERHRRERTFRSWYESDGRWKAQLTGPSDYGARMDAALRAEHDRLFTAAHAAGEREDPGAYKLDALMTLVELGAALDADDVTFSKSWAGVSAKDDAASGQSCRTGERAKEAQDSVVRQGCAPGQHEESDSQGRRTSGPEQGTNGSPGAQDRSPSRTHATHYQTPAADDHEPAANDQTPAADDHEPAANDQTPAADDPDEAAYSDRPATGTGESSDLDHAPAGEAARSPETPRGRSAGPAAEDDSPPGRDEVSSELARRQSCSCGGTGARRRSGRQTKVIVTIDADVLRKDRVEPGDTCHIAGIGEVSLTAIKELIPDAHLAYVIRNSMDVSAAHLGRQATAHQRTALEARGYECEVPNCRAAHLLEIDHVNDWAFSRKTILSELAWLCRHHHQLKSRQRYRLTGIPGNRTWQDDTGRVICGDAPAHDTPCEVPGAPVSRHEPREPVSGPVPGDPDHLRKPPGPFSPSTSPCSRTAAMDAAGDDVLLGHRTVQIGGCTSEPHPVRKLRRSRMVSRAGWTRRVETAINRFSGEGVGPP